MSDAELLKRATAGDGGAFGVLFERHADAILQFCFRRTASAALAEDLTSIVFLEAWRKRDKVEFLGETARAWLFGVALNVLRSHARAERRHRDALARLPSAPEGESETERAIARADAEREMRTLVAAVRKLGRRERDVLELCVWAELSTEEAACALDITPGAVRQRLSRARRRVALLAPSIPSSA